MTIQPISNDDLIKWPDGTMCTREELPEMTHMSDDSVVYPVDTPEWQQASDEYMES